MQELYLDWTAVKGSPLTGMLKDVLTLGINGMTGWDKDGWVWVDCCPVD